MYIFVVWFTKYAGSATEHSNTTQSLLKSVFGICHFQSYKNHNHIQFFFIFAFVVGYDSIFVKLEDKTDFI